MELLERIMEAHGGAARWHRTERVLACVSMGGLGFVSRLQGTPLRRVEVSLRTAWPDITLSDWPLAGQTGRCQPRCAWIEAADGGMVAERSAPGAVLRSPAHWFWWDAPDLLYYCANVLWQTLCLPFLLLREGCSVEERAGVTVHGERLWPLAIHLPGDIPLLRGEQVLYADATGLIRRLDFAPRFGAPLLRAAQLFDAYESTSGLVCATRYRIYPSTAGGRLLGMGPVGWIDVEDLAHSTTA